MGKQNCPPTNSLAAYQKKEESIVTAGKGPIFDSSSWYMKRGRDTKENEKKVEDVAESTYTHTHNMEGTAPRTVPHLLANRLENS